MSVLVGLPVPVPVPGPVIGPVPAARTVGELLPVALGVALGAVLALAVLTALAWYLTWTAARLDRLHARVEGARAALDAQLLRRASVALELATSGLVDPATGVLLADAAGAARRAEGPERELRESDLSAALRAALEEPEARRELTADPVGAYLLEELLAACDRVRLARRLHNDAVRLALVVRRQRVVRALRLAGHAPVPESVEMDDEPPALAPVV